MWEVREDSFLATLRGYVRRAACRLAKGANPSYADYQKDASGAA
jgi:hypothetical protein